jgi:hypothetical protein
MPLHNTKAHTSSTAGVRHAEALALNYAVTSGCTANTAAAAAAVAVLALLAAWQVPLMLSCCLG